MASADNIFFLASILAIAGGLMVVLNMCSIQLNAPIYGGIFAGLIVGDLEMGMLIGGTLTLMSLGLFNYGGATIPDYTSAAIIGTAVASLSGGENALEIGLAAAIPIALFLIQVDILGRTANTFYLHAAENDIEKGRFDRISLWHWMGATSWFLSRALPIFIAILLGNEAVAYVQFIPQWFTDGMVLTGKLLPAVGFALLLSKMDMNKYWPFLGLGFICYTYFSLPIMAITIITIISVGLLNQEKTNE